MSLRAQVGPEGLNEALAGIRWAFATAVLFAFLAAFFALFIRDSDAKATMVARAKPPKEPVPAPA